MAFGTDESVLFREVSTVYHMNVCTVYEYTHVCMYRLVKDVVQH